MNGKLTFNNIMRQLSGCVREERHEEFYAVAQLLALGELTNKEQKKLGEKLVKLIETDEWWRSNGAFRDD